MSEFDRGFLVAAKTAELAIYKTYGFYYAGKHIGWLEFKPGKLDKLTKELKELLVQNTLTP